MMRRASIDSIVVFDYSTVRMQLYCASSILRFELHSDSETSPAFV